MTKMQRFWTWFFKVSGVGSALGLWVKVLVSSELQAWLTQQMAPIRAQPSAPRPAPRTEIVTTLFDLKEAQFLAGIDCYQTPDGHLYTVVAGQSVRTQ